MKITNINVTAKEIDNTNIIGSARCVINGTVTVNNIAIRKNSNNNTVYVTMPQQKNAKTGNYLDVAFPVTAEARKELQDKILQAFSNPTEIKETEQTACSSNIDVKMYNVKQAPNSPSPVLARGSVTVDDTFCVKGVQLLTNKNGEPFIAFPSNYNKNTQKSYSLSAPASKEAYEVIAEKAIAAYESNVKAAEAYSFVKLTGDKLEAIAKTDIKIDCGKINDDGSCIARVPSDQKDKLDNVLNGAVKAVKQ